MLWQANGVGETRRGPLSALGVAGPSRRARRASNEGTDATSADGYGETASMLGVVVE